MQPTDMTKYVETEEQMPLAQLLSNAAIIHRFEMAAGTNAGAAMMNIFNAASANPDIFKCEPMTVINAALTAATMRLSISPALGQACILPFNKNQKVGKEWVTTKRAQLVVMVRGVKDMAMRTNKYRFLNAFPVYKGQRWVEDQMTELGQPEGNITEKVAIGYGAFLELFNGYKVTTYMTVDELMAHAQQYSPTFDKREGKFNDKSRWVTHFDEQARKTVLKKLIMNKGVISEDDRAVLENAMSETSNSEILEGQQDTDEITGEVKDMPAETKLEPTAEEIAYNDAKLVRTPSNKLVIELPADQFTALLADKYSEKEAGKAARIIDAHDKKIAAQNEKALSELGF